MLTPSDSTFDEVTPTQRCKRLVLENLAYEKLLDRILNQEPQVGVLTTLGSRLGSEVKKHKEPHSHTPPYRTQRVLCTYMILSRVCGNPPNVGFLRCRPSPCLCLSLSVCLRLSLSVSVCLSLSVCLCLSPSLSLSLSPSLPLPLSLSLSLSPSLSLSLSLSLSISLGGQRNVTLEIPVNNHTPQ